MYFQPQSPQKDPRLALMNSRNYSNDCVRESTAHDTTRHSTSPVITPRHVMLPIKCVYVCVYVCAERDNDPCRGPTLGIHMLLQL